MYFRTGKGKGTRPAARFPPAHKNPPTSVVGPPGRESVRVCARVPSRAEPCRALLCVARTGGEGDEGGALAAPSGSWRGAVWEGRPSRWREAKSPKKNLSPESSPEKNETIK